MVNGYSPVVPRSYVQEIFWPLYGLDLGLVDHRALDTLKRLKVKLVAFFDDDLVYPAQGEPLSPGPGPQTPGGLGLF